MRDMAEMVETEHVSCADARTHIRSLLRRVYSGLPLAQAQRLRDDALLVASELTANARLHASGVTRFRARLSGSELQIQVSDSSPAVPQYVPTVPGRPGGYGWMVIQRLSARVEIERERYGKTITVALALP